MADPDVLREGERLMTVCNACRYCEGYCAVFPAMERRLQFADGDLRYLANLCHNCAECYYACQYAPPHEFAVNVPRVLAEIRLASYERYAWPALLARAFRRNGTLVAMLLVAALVIAVAAAGWLDSGRRPGDFYSVVSHRAMVTSFGFLGIFVLVVWIVGFVRFWRDTRESLTALSRGEAIIKAFRDILTLEYLRSGGAGCTYPNARHSGARRWFHHFTFYGFLLCFASTCVAAVYDNLLGSKAPYSYLSVPVVLGMAGGAGLLIGPAGLLALKLRRDSAIVDTNQDGMDSAFMVLLLMNSITGLLLLIMRDTAAVSYLLLVHLAAVLILFLAMAYGKFVHGIYRSAALIRYALEFSRPAGGR